VDGWALRERAQGVGGRTEAELDPIGEAGLLPVAACNAGPFLAHVAAEEASSWREAAGNGDGAVAGEGADLDREFDAEEPREPGEKGTLLDGDLHHADGTERRRLRRERA